MNQDYVELAFLTFYNQRERIGSENPAICVVRLRSKFLNLLSTVRSFMDAHNLGLELKKVPAMTADNKPMDYTEYWNWIQEVLQELSKALFKQKIISLSRRGYYNEILLEGKNIAIQKIR